MTAQSSDTQPDAVTTAPNQRSAIVALGQFAVGIFIIVSGILGLAVAVQLQDIAPDQKEWALGLVAALGALAGVIGTPIWGMLSDRTRSRWGRRAPIVVAASVVALIGVAVLATAGSVAAVAIGAATLQVGFAGVQAPAAALLPDRISARLRGIASSMLGLGVMLGGLIGQLLASALLPLSVPLTYAVGAAIYVITALVFLVLTRDASSRDLVIEPLDLRTFLGTFWVNPRRHPDFAWAFWGRAAMFLGFASVNSFLLYILQGYAGMSQAEALAAVPMIALATFAGILLSILVSGWLSDRWCRRKPFVIASSLIAAVASVIPLAFPTLPGLIGFAFVAGIAYGCYLAIDNALISLVLPSASSSAKDLGVANIASGGASALAPAVAAFIIVNLGGYPPLFIVSAAMSVLSAVLVIPIKGVR